MFIVGCRYSCEGEEGRRVEKAPQGTVKDHPKYLQPIQLYQQGRSLHIISGQRSGGSFFLINDI